MYDLVAGRQLVKKSYFMGKEKTLENFPMLKKKNLCGAIVYYDGMFDNSLFDGYHLPNQGIRKFT